MNDRSHCLDVRELLIAYRSGEVTPLQRERVEIHLAGCSACKAELSFEGELERSARAGPEPLTDLKKRQILGQIHERLAEEEERVSFWRRPFVLAPAGGLVAIAATFAILLSLPEALPTQEGWLETSGGIEAFAPEGTKVAFEQTKSGPVIRLDSRAVFARYNRLPGQAPLRVETPHGDAIIRGTIFFVDVRDDHTEVGVQRGTVEVADRSGHSVLVGPGEQARSTREAVRSIAPESPRFAALREVFPPARNTGATVATVEPAPKTRPRVRRPRFRPTPEATPEPAPEPVVIPEDPGPDPQVIARVVGRFLPLFQSCYERGLKNHPELEGRIVAQLTYGTDGVILEGMYLVDELQTPEVTDCLRDNLLQLEFPPARSEVTVQIPLAFEPGGVRHDSSRR